MSALSFYKTYTLLLSDNIFTFIFETNTKSNEKNTFNFTSILIKL
jgi:hypothetical protein